MFDQGRWWDLRDKDPARLAARGWLPVTLTARPADTPTTTTDYAVALVAGVPTETWTSRAKTAAEIAAATAATNRATLTGTATLDGRLTRLAAYKTDPEIVAALARSNTTAITTQELNRLVKVMLRREERLTATVALLVRLLDPALLASISDTTDS